MNKNKESKKGEDGIQEKATWDHASSRKEVNALKAMLQKNVRNFKKKLDEQNRKKDKD